MFTIGNKNVVRNITTQMNIIKLLKYDIIKFLDKWTEIETIILSEVTQNPNNKYCCLLLYVEISFYIFSYVSFS